MPFKPNDPKTKEIASKGAKAKNEKYPEHYRKWLFKKDDLRTKELSRKGVLERHKKFSDIHEFYSKLGRKSRDFENKVVESIKNKYDKIFYISSICDRIALRGDELIFIEIKKPGRRLRPQQKEIAEMLKNIKKVSFEIRP
jgi:hypothetical protein